MYFFLLSLAGHLLMLLIFSKNMCLVSLIPDVFCLFVCLFVFSFIACCFLFFFFVILNLGPQQWKPQILTSGLPGNSLLPLVLICFSYPLFLRWKALIINLRYFFLSIRVFECYTYSSEHCFSWVSHIVIFSTLILFSVIKLLHFTLRHSLWLM